MGRALARWGVHGAAVPHATGGKSELRARGAPNYSPMARKDLFRRRQLRLGGDEDRLSALPDDVLLQILRRLDTRTALGAAMLSRRWANLLRELPVLDLRVTDTLPQRYHRCLLRRGEASSLLLLPESSSRRLTAMTGRYDRRAMRNMVASVKGLILASRAAHRRRRVSKLSLEIFACSTSPWINRLVMDAVESWGVRDLEVIATPTEPIAFPPPVYRFPHGRISRKPVESRLRSLKLANCLPPPLQGFAALTTLILQDLPNSTPASVYEGVVVTCPQLQVLHLVSCRFESLYRRLVFDAPMSGIRELAIDGGHLLRTVEVRSLPKLESLATLHASVQLCSDAAAPCLENVKFVFDGCSVEGHNLNVILHHLTLDHISSMLMRFFRSAHSMMDLILRFTGPGLWIALKNPYCPMHNLRRLLVVDVPSSCDLSGPHVLLEAAPLLESIHVHAPPCEDELGQEIPWQPPSTSRHCHLKELVVVGFRRTERYLRLVRYTMELSMVLQRVALFKHGHVKDKGTCGWELVTQQSTWSNEEKLTVLDGISCPTAQVELVLG